MRNTIYFNYIICAPHLWDLNVLAIHVLALILKYNVYKMAQPFAVTHARQKDYHKNNSIFKSTAQLDSTKRHIVVIKYQTFIIQQNVKCY